MGVARSGQLSQREIARLDGWRDRWSSVGLRTGPAERDRFERAVRDCYRFADIEWPGVVVLVPSPLVLALAAPTAARAIQLIEGKRRPAPILPLVNPSRRSFGTKAEDGVDLELAKTLPEPVRSAVDAAVRQAVREATSETATVKGHDSTDRVRALVLRVSVGAALVNAVAGVVVGALSAALQSAAQRTLKRHHAALRARERSLSTFSATHPPSPRLGPSARLAKRALDVVVSAVLLPVVLPFFLVVAALIKLDSGGPVLFRQRRLGAGGREFTLLRFRTLTDLADDPSHLGVAFANHTSDPRISTLPTDPRVTRVGRWLRAHSLDMLPQLWNVLCGEMSLVGPQPLLAIEEEFVERWTRRPLDLKPGMTGLWQVLGRDGIPFEEIVRLDDLYVRTWSLWTDLRIIGATMPSLLRTQEVPLGQNEALRAHVALQDSALDALGNAVHEAVDTVIETAPLVWLKHNGSRQPFNLQAWRSYVGGQFWGNGQQGSPALTSFFRDACKLELPGDLWDRARAFETTARSACWWWPHPRFVMVCEHPLAIHRDPTEPAHMRWLGGHRLHREDGPAIVWPDGWGIHAWHGIQVPAEVIEHPETITAERVLGEPNLEVRRAILEKVGYEPLQAVAESVNTDDYGELLRINQTDDEPILLVKVVNSTPEPDGSFRDYLIRVDPNCQTAHEAVAWSFDIHPNDYQLAKET